MTRPQAHSYIRMSTDLQLRGDSLRRQLQASTKYAAENNLDLVEHIRLEDIGVSAFKGANVSGGALGRFFEAVQTGRIARGSYLLVESLDRISRQELRKSLQIFLSIIDAGINIVTLADNHVYTAEKTELVDLVTSLVIMSRAHEKSQMKSRRVGAAWANKRANAKTKPLTAQCPAWLELSADRTAYEVHEDRAKIIRRIFREAANGVGSYSITRQLNEDSITPFARSRGWQMSYVSKILNNRSVIGEYQPHKMVAGKRVPDGPAITNYFPAVVEQELFYRAQQGRRERLARGAGRKGKFISNLFSGLATCAYCRAPMHFENKGYPPKGACYLVCDAARRGLGCETKRWRYDHFETSFLAFVREVDLAQIVHSEEVAARRSALEASIEALQGELATIGQQMDRTYELFAIAGEAKEFVAAKLKALESRRAAIDEELRLKQAERTAITAEVSAYYESKDQVKALLAQLQGRDGDEVYKLRAQIAARLKSLVTTIIVAPLGDAPLTRRTIEFLSNQPDAEDVIAHLERMSEDEAEHRRFFAVGLADGTVRAVHPSDEDPLQFHQQLLANKRGMVRIHQSGEVEEVIPPPLSADELLT